MRLSPFLLFFILLCGSHLSAQETPVPNITKVNIQHIVNCETGEGECPTIIIKRTAENEAVKLVVPPGGTVSTLSMYQQKDYSKIFCGDCPDSVKPVLTSTVGINALHKLDLSGLPDGSYTLHLMACHLGGFIPIYLHTRTRSPGGKHIEEEITLGDFQKKLEACAFWLNSLSFTSLSEDQHVEIMRSYNTVWINRDELTEIRTSVEVFEKALQNQRYEEKLPEHLDFTFNRGMGYYFPDLEIEWGGTPRAWSFYQLKASQPTSD